MCGIVGVVTDSPNKNTVRNSNLIKDLLFIDTLRGEDSTGVFKVQNNGQVHYRKHAVAGPEFLDMKKNDKFLNNINNCNFIVGHNRKATRGAVNATNAHPFKYKHITMVHNGTITNQKELATAPEVDSEAICHALADLGQEKTLEKIRGAFALVWYNNVTKKLYMIRNDERPLAIARIEGENSFIFASELGMISLVAARHKVSVKGGGYIPKGELYSFDTEAKKPTIKKLKLYNPYDYSGWAGRGGYQTPASANRKRAKFQIISYEPYSGSPHGTSGKLLLQSLAPAYAKAKIVCYQTRKGEFDPEFYYDCEIGQTTYEGGNITEVTVRDLKKTNIMPPIVSRLTKKDVYGDSHNVLQLPDKKKDMVSIGNEMKKDKEPADKEEQSETLTGSVCCGPQHRMVSEKHFKELTKHGCSHCSADLIPEESFTVYWDDNNNPYCSQCAGDSDVTRDRNLH